MIKPRKSKSFSQRDISIAINNAMSVASRPAKIGEIPQDRIRKVREFTNAVAMTLTEYLEIDLLSPEELVYSLLGAAMFVQTVAVMKSENPLQTETTKDLWAMEEGEERPEDA